MVVSGFSGTQTARLLDLVVRNNEVHNIGKGGGIYVFDISPTINNMTATGNSAGSDGGGLWLASYLVRSVGHFLHGFWPYLCLL